MYYEYWGLQKAPFDNVPDPSMYVESHASVETAVAETLFAIEEGGECIAVIVGEIGAGKTLSLRLILDSLNRDRIPHRPDHQPRHDVHTAPEGHSGPDHGHGVHRRPESRPSRDI
jgi:type II secretory pathway predicted ATPase ExeA